MKAFPVYPEPVQAAKTPAMGSHQNDSLSPVPGLSVSHASLDHLRETPLPGSVFDETIPSAVTATGRYEQGSSSTDLLAVHNSRPASSRTHVSTVSRYHGPSSLTSGTVNRPPAIIDHEQLFRRMSGNVPAEYFDSHGPDANGFANGNRPRRLSVVAVERLSNTSSDEGRFTRWQYCRLSRCHLASLALLCNPVIGACALYYAVLSIRAIQQQNEDDAERWSDLAQAVAIMAIFISLVVIALSLALTLGR